MKKTGFSIVVIALIGATFSGCTDTSNSNNSRAVNSNASNANANAAQTSRQAPTIQQALADKSYNVNDRVKAVEVYVGEIEAKLSGLTRKEKRLKPDDLKGVTDEKWSKIDAYYAGNTLRRIQTYPAGSSKGTEEIYVYDDKPVFVFIKPEGGNEEGQDRNERGEKLYFGDEGLIAWYGEDGQAKDPNSPEFKMMNDKMMGEIAAFRKLVGS